MKVLMITHCDQKTICRQMTIKQDNLQDMKYTTENCNFPCLSTKINQHCTRLVIYYLIFIKMAQTKGVLTQLCLQAKENHNLCTQHLYSQASSGSLLPAVLQCPACTYLSKLQVFNLQECFCNNLTVYINSEVSRKMRKEKKWNTTLLIIFLAGGTQILTNTKQS